MPTTYAIPNGATQFAATLWTGNNGTQSIVNGASTSGTSFQPDLVWLKQRTPTGTGHILEDSVRGALQYLGSESTAGESTIAGTVTLFNSNGFSIGSQAGTNATGSSYVGWQWKASNATAVNIAIGSISSGVPSIASAVSANPTAGFSIVTYTGTGVAGTIGHGLNSTPKMIIVKWRTGGTTESWAVYHNSIAATNYLSLNTTNPSVASSSLWNNISPTANVFSVGTDTWVNASTRTYVAYCWSEIDGYSKFGSYVGTGVAATAPFVYLGFKPKLILLKATTTGSAENWIYIDTARNPNNVNTNQWLYPNLAAVEGTTTAGSVVDVLSNGFKLRGFTGTPNTSAVTYIYAAFAENPFKYANAQ